MAIIAYASANADPVANPEEDYVYDIDVVPLGGAVPLHGAAVDSADPGAVWAWGWLLASYMPGSTVAIDDPTAPDISVSPIDQWGNVRLLLVATNTNSGQSSEADPLRAPTSAFVTIRVLSEDKSLQKMAAGERNWFDDYWALVDVVENLPGLGAHNIIDHLDVTAATGPDLGQMTQGGYAIDPAGTNPANDEGFSILHKHYGSDVNVATSLHRGAVKLATPWTGGGEPEVMVKQIQVYNGQALHSQIDGGIVDLVRPHVNGFNAVNYKNMLPAHILWAIPSDCYIKHWDFCIMSIPRWDGPGVYKLGLIRFTSLANIDNNVYTIVAGSTVTLGAPAVLGGPIAVTQPVALDITGPCWIGVQVIEEPDTAPEFGFGLQASMLTEV